MYGLRGILSSLASVLTSDKVKVDVERQIRLWSGNLYDDKDFEASILEILPIYYPPEDPENPACKDKVEPQAFEGADADGNLSYNSATQNAAFSGNLPGWDVRKQLKEIMVKHI